MGVGAGAAGSAPCPALTALSLVSLKTTQRIMQYK